MKKIIFLVLTSLFFNNCAMARQVKEPRLLNSIEKEFKATKFQIKKNKNLINSRIISLLSSSNNVSIANPGEKYNWGDQIDPNLPSRGFIFAGEAKNMSFVYYGQGGKVWKPQLMFIKLKNNEIVYTCHYVIDFLGWEIYEDLDQIKQYFPLISHKIDGMCDETKE